MLIFSVICLILGQLVKNSTEAQAALAAFCISGVRVSKLRLTLACLSACDYVTLWHIFAKPQFRYLFTWLLLNYLETGGCTSQADLTACLSFLSKSLERSHCRTFSKMASNLFAQVLFAQVLFALVFMTSASTTTRTALAEDFGMDMS